MIKWIILILTLLIISNVSAEIIIISPEDKTYDTLHVPLNISLSENATECKYTIEGIEQNKSMEMQNPRYFYKDYIIPNEGTYFLSFLCIENNKTIFNQISFSVVLPIILDENTSQENDDYNRELICEQTSYFIQVYSTGNNITYTDKEYEEFKNRLSILTGFGVNDNVLKSYIHEFWINCPEYIKNPENQGNQIEEDPGFNYMPFLFIGIIFLFLILVGIIIYKNYLNRLISGE